MVQSVVLPLAVINSSSVEYVGTCFNILPAGLFVTAKHVIDEAMAIKNRRTDTWIGISWTAPGTPIDKKRGLVSEFFEVRTVSHADIPDVALVEIEPNKVGEAKLFPSLSLDLRPPSSTSRIFACGYTKMDLNWVRIEGGVQTVDVIAAVHAARGEVVELHPDGRDSFSINFPAFRADSRFVGGMSGGPVINEASGGVCGLVCSGFAGESDEVEHISYATMAVSMLGLGIPGDCSGDEPGRLLYDLVSDGSVRCEGGLENITLERSPAGRFRIGFRT